MKRHIILTCFVILSVMLFTNMIEATERSESISQKTSQMKKYPGYFNFYWDEAGGKIWLEIDKLDTEFLYVNSLPRGIGSNDIGLDRGQLGQSRIVKFQRFGPKVLLIQPNYSFRAITNDENEKRAVQESFAQSVLWGFTIAAEENGNVLVDATAFYLRDAHNVIGTLKRSDQGNFHLDSDRSAVYLPRTKNFLKNTEVEAILTFTGESPGVYLRQVVPSPNAVTVHQHHSFIELPDDNYTPRRFDPRCGFFGPGFINYAAAIGDPMQERFIARHRLRKKNPDAKVSEAVKPIVYYIDNAAPEPIRSALVEGAKWWNEAFEAAGYKNAFQVKVLPQGVDMMDVRYNVVQWVHRATRGWSYGSSVTDPRTGEIIKGHVTLGSLRLRQDYLIAQGLLAPYEDGKPMPDRMKEMALARIRQLSAHEIGHTLGLSHNYAASAFNRASVMDYPHPWIKLNKNGSIDVSDAYDVGIGEWDKVTIAYGYQDFPTGTDEKQALDQILQDAFSKGLIFITDQDSRPPGSAHPLGHLWDNGANIIDELVQVMLVRAKALQQFGEKNILPGMPFATLEDVLVPVYLYHRYQTEAVTKIIGGLNYTYALRGDGQLITELIAPKEQRRALDEVLQTIQPDFLAIPERILEIIPPHPPGFPRTREDFTTKTGLTFDPLTVAESAANSSISLLLNPQRAARLVEYHARHADQPGFSEIVEKLIDATWKAKHESGYTGAIQRIVDNVVLHNLMKLVNDSNTSDAVQELAYLKLDELKTWITNKLDNELAEDQKGHFLFTKAQIEQFQKNPKQFKMEEPVAPPPGSPIGEY